MLYKTLGKSSLQISQIGFGCMSLKPMQTDFQYIIDTAINKGINYFDTADLYDKGLNEASLGKALQPHRDKIIIASKVGNVWKEDGKGFTWNPRKEYIVKAIDESLQRLQTDYIDLYQLHGGTIDDPMDETIEAFELLQQWGKIRYYGISSIRPNVIREYVERSNIVSVMMQYSLLDRRPEESCLQLLKESSIGVLARGSVASGLLVDKPAKPYLNYTEQQVSCVVQAIHSLQYHNGAETAIRFVLNHPAITSAVVGVRTIQQLEDAVAAVDFKLSDDESEMHRQAVPTNFYEQHR